MARLPLIDGDEQDALTRARRFYHWRPGQVRRIKRRVSKRERRYGRTEALRDASAADYPSRLGARYPVLADNGDSVLVWCSPAEVWLECCGTHLIDHHHIGIERLAVEHWRTHHGDTTDAHPAHNEEEPTMTEPHDNPATEPELPDTGVAEDQDGNEHADVATEPEDDTPDEQDTEGTDAEGE